MQEDSSEFITCQVSGCDQESTHLYNIPYQGAAHLCRPHFRQATSSARSVIVLKTPRVETHVLDITPDEGYARE